MDPFILIVTYAALGMLVWDCVEVGRNDAANLVNAVFGARVMRRRTAVWVAGLAVVLGATFASPVMETARKGIFDPGQLSIDQALSVYISAYVVDTVLLYALSAFGMPVSTTATLLFSLVGGAIGVSLGVGIVSWPKVWTVIAAIVMSIFLSGVAGFLIQRAFRGALRQNAQDPIRVFLHGPWIAGLILTWLTWFMLVKGLKGLAFVKYLETSTIEKFGEFPVLLTLWGFYSLLVYALLALFREKGTRYLFHGTTLIGMVCMAFAFGQNDLANCASPGLSSLYLYRHADIGVGEASDIAISRWWLFGCGLLMAIGMGTRNAQRVTRAEVNTGSQHDQVALWAPNWCRALGRSFMRKESVEIEIAPPPSVNAAGKRLHYDTLRASVIMAVSGSVIAFASGKGLPVSTTYVAFAAVVATGWGDRVFHRGDADLKLGRAIWVVTSWFLAALVAVVASGVVAMVIYNFKIAGLVIALAANLLVRWYFAKRAEAHETKYHTSKEGTIGADDDGQL